MEKSCSHCGKPVDSHGAKGYCATCYARFRRNGTADKRVPMAAGNCSYCGGPIGPKGAKGYCAKHYARFRKHGDPSISLIDRENAGGPCSQCGKPAVARGYCGTCYQRWSKHGDPSIVLTTAERNCSHCGDPVGRHGGYGYCGRCYRHWRRHGDPSITLTRGGKRSSGGSSYRKYALNDEYFDQIDTPNKAYWLGFITADGCVLEDATGKPSYLRVELARYDDDHLRSLCVDLGSDRPVLYYQGCACVSFGSRHMANALCRLGVTPRKSLIVEPWVGPADLMPHYWRGLFDGDGGMCKSAGYWHAKVCGSEACVQAFAVWARLTCGSRAKAIPVRPGHACWQWQVSGSLKAQILVRALYEDAPVALERKRLLARELCAIDFDEMKAQANARRIVAMRDAWATGRHPRAKKM